jgi:hypothetical protein
MILFHDRARFENIDHTYSSTATKLNEGNRRINIGNAAATTQ